MAEIVYILTNPAIPDLIKVGRTTNLEERIRSLSFHAGVPAPFECYFACEVDDSADIEKRLHFGFGDHRYNPKREFFSINPERIKMILEGYGRDVTPTSDIVEDESDAATLKRARARRPAIRFSMIDIPVGAELNFLKNESITCRIAGDREVEFEGEVTSLNKATLKIFKTLYGREQESVRGPDFWLFEGETLTERRLRLEQSDEAD
ncbi:MAG: GIY-YIG nuclease family protein [Gammaproteobacteria bacterium AqS3]|nr:GIY-YIG nuclease family protein [Gammaproteobacteria bacterium AqS3]